MPVCISLIGATGKAGKNILFNALQNSDFQVIAAIASKTSSFLGVDIGKLVSLSLTGLYVDNNIENSISKADVLIDFSTIDAFSTNLFFAKKYQKPIVIGTTGLKAQQEELLKDISKEIPVLYSPNFSFGIAFFVEILSHLPRYIKEHFSFEISETHHQFKKDRPSGTALTLAKTFVENTPLKKEEHFPQIKSYREGEVLGEHTILLKNSFESIKLTHEVLSRDAFAKGALLAAKQLLSKPKGLYSIKDLFSDEKE